MALKKLLICLGCLIPAGDTHALLLGGVEVPKEKVIVYLLIGHSNMHGMDTRLCDGVTHPRAWNYQWWSTKQWIPARETPGNANNGLSGHGEGGPGMPMLKGLAEAYPQYYFGVISNASSSCTLRGVNTGNNGSGIPSESNRYWKGATLYNEIIASAKAVQKDVTLGGIVCMLGAVEATRTSTAICQAFSDDAAQMATDMRLDLGMPNLPFIMGEYEHGATGNFAISLPWPKILLEQTKLIPSKLSNSASVISEGIAMRDDHHYSTDKGQPEFARRMVDIIKAKGWVGGSTGILSRKPDAVSRMSGQGNRIYPVAGRIGFLSPGSLPTLYLTNGRNLGLSENPRLR